MRSSGLLAIVGLLALAASFACAAPASARGPSFDCSQATTLVRRAICSDPSLSSMEQDVIDDFYQMSRLLPMDTRRVIRLRIVDWLAQIEQTCGDPAATQASRSQCLSAEMLRQTTELDGEIAARAPKNSGGPAK